MERQKESKRLPPAVGAIEASSPLQAVSNDRVVLIVRRYSHRCDHAHHEDPDCDHAVDDTRSAAVEQTIVAGQQSVLPRRLQDRNEADDADELEVALRAVSDEGRFAKIDWDTIREAPVSCPFSTFRAHLRRCRLSD